MTCVLDADGSLRCAGSNANGLLGDPALADVALPTRVPVPPLRDVVLLGDTSCGVAADGEDVWCWGSDAFGIVSGAPSSAAASPRVAYTSPTHIVALGGNPRFVVVATHDEAVGWGGGAIDSIGTSVDTEGRVHFDIAGARLVGRGLSTAVCVATADAVSCSGTFFSGSARRIVQGLTIPLVDAHWLDVEDDAVVTIDAAAVERTWHALDDSLATADGLVVADTRGATSTTRTTWQLLPDGSVREYALDRGVRTLVTTHALPSPAVWLEARCNTACVVLRDGTVSCAGVNRSGELARGHVSDTETAFAPAAY